MIDNKGVLEKVTSTEVRGKVTDKFPVLPMDRRKGKNKEGLDGIQVASSTYCNIGTPLDLIRGRY